MGGTPGAFQQQPSPSLTPRSEDGDSCGSRRGTTPAPNTAENAAMNNPLEQQLTGSSGPNPSMLETNAMMSPSNGMIGDPSTSQKVVKRRPSQQKRRQSQTQGGFSALGTASKLDGGPAAKKQRPRKGSKIDESDYDAFIDTVMGHLKNLPPVTTVEPKMGHYYNACPIFGEGDIPKLCKTDSQDLRTGSL